MASPTFPVFEAMQPHLIPHTPSLLACFLAKTCLPGSYPSWLGPSRKMETLLFPLVFACDSQACAVDVFLT